MLEEEKTDSESSCLLFEKEKRLPERMHYVCRKYTLNSLDGVSRILCFFETPSAGATPFCLTSSATSLQDAPHLSASRHLPRYRGSLPRFNVGIHLRKAGKGSAQDDENGCFYEFLL